ncbi:hypothetical protein DFH94DRAFT_356799 [Russula ochroleuca]|jgi:hypothetical protein|uniref:Uncharacterized protein n=1 Tax=Russula ochroleuca TaxID=152965 RepID=A0A9P5MMX3_9AGAM|nr:hypothetical protein DFH94DRAFT_356799 [Russula ochroleuca]
MSYDATIQNYANSLGPNAAKDKFHCIYFGVLAHWFPTTRGYLIDHQVLGPAGKVEYIVIRQEGGSHNPLFVVKLNHPSKWTAAGQQMAVDKLVDHIKGQFDLTQYDTIYGLSGIGLHWIVYKMQRSGNFQSTLLVNWQDNIASDASYAEFAVIADLVYSLAD